jgi:hypothetical protein
VRLCRCSHKAYQRVPHRLLHGILGRAVEREVVDHSADHHASPHKVADAERGHRARVGIGRRGVYEPDNRH